MKSYTFHVSLPGTGRVWRKLELRADQTLEDLHLAIQNAYAWGNDHLYSFFMSNKAWDPETEYTLPEGALYENYEEEYDEEDEAEEGTAFSLEEWNAMSEKERNAMVRDFTKETGLPAAFFHEMIKELEQMAQSPEMFEDEPQERNVRETTLDSLALKPKQEFMYLFDYGDSHEFKVRVEAIGESKADETYPRLVESVGDAPAQYPSWEDEDWDEEK